MLQLNNTNLISRVLDPVWLSRRFQEIGIGRTESETVKDVRVLYAKASANRCRFLYELELASSLGEVRRQYISGYCLPSDQLYSEYDSLRTRTGGEPLSEKPIALIEEENLILLTFPNDRKLRLLSESALKSLLTSHVAELVNGSLDHGGWSAHGIDLEVLRYVPEKRLTMRCHVRVVRNHTERNATFIAKQFNSPKKAEAHFRNLVSLHKAYMKTSAAADSRDVSSADQEFVLNLPWALGWERAECAVFQKDLGGKNLELVLNEIEVDKVLIALGKILVRFQSLNFRPNKHVNYQSELVEVTRASETISLTLPTVTGRLRDLLAALQGLQRPSKDTPPVLLHGSFRLNHVSLSGDRLALLDLGSLRSGHPAYDLANFVSSLYYLEAQERIRPTERRMVSRYLLKGYCENARWTLHPEDILWFTASLLVNKQSKKIVTHLHKRQQEHVERFLQTAETILYDLCTPSTIPSMNDLWKELP